MRNLSALRRFGYTAGESIRFANPLKAHEHRNDRFLC
jgi:hypothetical protein